MKARGEENGNLWSIRGAALAKGPQKISAKAKSGSQDVRLRYNAPYPVSACTLGVNGNADSLPWALVLNVVGITDPLEVWVPSPQRGSHITLHTVSGLTRSIPAVRNDGSLALRPSHVRALYLLF